MRGLGVFLLIIASPVVAIGDTTGIEETNYRAGISGRNSDSGNSFSFSGVVRAPLVNNTGISLNVGLSEHNGVDNYVDQSNKSIGLGVFLREYELGLIQLRYNYSETVADIPSSTLKMNTDSLSLFGIYYIHNFNFSLFRSALKSDDGDKFNNLNIGLSYYFTDNFNTSLSFGGMESKDNNAISMYYQPKKFNNTIGISVNYSTSDRVDSYGLSVTYYFDTKVSLIDRNRRY